MIAVLHTWGQTLTHHPHAHCVVILDPPPLDGDPPSLILDPPSLRRGPPLPLRTGGVMIRASTPCGPRRSSNTWPGSTTLASSQPP
jgi:hypothetical protein